MRNRLINPLLEELFLRYPFYSQDGRGFDAVCICAFFVEDVRWYVLEGQQEGDDFILYAIVVGLSETEYGYVSANELQELSVNGNHYGLGCLEVTQMPEINEIPLSEIRDSELQSFLFDLYG